MYNKKRLWATTYLAEGFWLGMKSNQRSEILHSSLHLHLDGDMTMVAMARHYENAIGRFRENEAQDECTASQTFPALVTNFSALEFATAETFTPVVFYILQKEISKTGSIQILEKHLGED